jgi:hypothetical protein
MVPENKQNRRNKQINIIGLQNNRHMVAIQERMTAVLLSIPKEAFADSFQKFYERCQQCVVKVGYYFVCIFCSVCFLLPFTKLFRHTISVTIVHIYMQNLFK